MCGLVAGTRRRSGVSCRPGDGVGARPWTFQVLLGHRLPRRAGGCAWAVLGASR